MNAFIPATSTVIIGSGPGGQHTMFADSVDTVNRWLASGYMHKHTERQTPTHHAVCECPEIITTITQPVVVEPVEPVCHCGGTIVPSTDDDVSLNPCEGYCSVCMLVYAYCITGCRCEAL
jgi:hypothetical protein